MLDRREALAAMGAFVSCGAIAKKEENPKNLPVVKFHEKKLWLITNMEELMGNAKFKKIHQSHADVQSACVPLFERTAQIWLPEKERVFVNLEDDEFMFDCPDESSYHNRDYEDKFLFWGEVTLRQTWDVAFYTEFLPCKDSIIYATIGREPNPDFETDDIEEYLKKHNLPREPDVLDNI